MKKFSILLAVAGILVALAQGCEASMHNGHDASSGDAGSTDTGSTDTTTSDGSADTGGGGGGGMDM